MFGIFDAPEPWGPWTTLGYGADFPDWTHAPAEKDRPAFMRTFPLKWISKTGNDELTMWNIYDRGDRFNLVKVTLQLNDDVLADDTHR